ncbi:hypothetical protein [Peijinzhouia sedimentorum]
MKSMNFTGKSVLFGLLIMFFFTGVASAQDEVEEVTDEELRKYAIVEDSVQRVLKSKTADFNDALRDAELMNGGRRYVEIKGAGEDEAKLAELEVTEEEMAEYNGLRDMELAIMTDVTELKKSLVTNDEILGIPIYNKVNRLIKSDADVKARLDVIMAAVVAENADEEDTAEDGE